VKQALVGALLGLVMVPNIVLGATKIPDGFYGEWTTRVVKENGFPWWSEVKYPVRLIVSDNGVVLEDQTSTSCTPTVAFWNAPRPLGQGYVRFSST